jgi:hypothetical protein
MAVTASLVINFGDVTDMYLSAEVNADDNEGKTSFQAGDEVKFRIYFSGDTSPQPYEVIQTIGSTSKDSTGLTTNIKNLTDDGLGEVVQYAFSATTSTSKYIHTLNSYSWMGTAPLINGAAGVIKKSNHAELSGGAETQIGIARVDYDTRYDLWTYSSPASVTVGGVLTTNYSVIIGISALVV